MQLLQLMLLLQNILIIFLHSHYLRAMLYYFKGGESIGKIEGENELSSITEKTFNNHISISNVSTGNFNWEIINYFDDDNCCTKS